MCLQGSRSSRTNFVIR